MLQELSFAEQDEVSGGSFASVGATWVNGYGSASAFGYASPYVASASISGNITPFYYGGTATLSVGATAFV